MSQISPPIRILLAGAVLFMVAWMTVLKPKTDVGEPATPAPAANVEAGTPAVSDPGQAVQTAQGAASTASTAASARAGEAPATVAAAPATSQSAPATSAAPATPATPADPTEAAARASEAGLPQSVARAIAKKQVLVMLFWNSKAVDDRAVRRELRGIDRHKGKVKVHVANIKDVARYGPITRGVDLNQSPTVVVVDRKLKAEALVGFNARRSIDQAVSDALRAR